MADALPVWPGGVAALSAGDKAEVLVEALPYIRRFRGSTVVVKYGGNAMRGSDGLALFADDVVLLRAVGMNVVVVHGGGPQIGEMMTRLGKVPEFVDGLRVTDADTLEIARMVLVGKVNRDIVGAVNVAGAPAVGVSGEDAGLLQARARSVELGYVGDIDEVRPAILRRLLNEELVPVVATIGTDEEGQAYNINADTAAGAIAEALGAEKLVYLTDVEGLRRQPDDAASVLSTVSVDELDAMVDEGAVAGGMVPKATSCTKAVRAGVAHAHILDGRVPHVLLLEVFTRSGIGTMVAR
ncbi:MAG: acetylglutamate kinase [Actinobacteria bacterium]|nr:acetylglutamate kinase [Actinomycetota bacterium]MBW3643504.1 acetylglutamate kinase [Actinomycetota bacterium]